MDGQDRRQQQRGGALAWQIQDGGTDDRHSVSAVWPAAVWGADRTRGAGAHCCGRRTHCLVHVLLPQAGVARDPRPLRTLLGTCMSASTQAMSLPDSADIKRRDWLIISLVGGAHACSHFFQLVLPTLYLSLAQEYGYDFAQLGFLASIFFLVSSIGQASSGFIVDRIGPAPVLNFG